MGLWWLLRTIDANEQNVVRGKLDGCVIGESDLLA
jgi:hypothetical protein